ncbi:hypothetical protein CDL15_Pgr010904 [Punica granatum]|uniref:Uncharacterized protein n=1 Tax=Punica granatum TaxID=22663 RepID=A0A218XMR0_PUNGR|nr:hypothetical protein CDL15_Pgr010904 [Punica granatum]PKI50583.1 hypothetical protein CRG98_029023 [Punica granatum]
MASCRPFPIEVVRVSSMIAGNLKVRGVPIDEVPFLSNWEISSRTKISRFGMRGFASDQPSLFEVAGIGR